MILNIQKTQLKRLSLHIAHLKFSFILPNLTFFPTSSKYLSRILGFCESIIFGKSRLHQGKEDSLVSGLLFIIFYKYNFKKHFVFLL